MSNILVQFYRLPPEFIAQCFLLLSFAFLLLWNRFGACRWFRLWVGTFLILWAAVTLWTTVLSRAPGTVYPPELIPFHSYRKYLGSGNSAHARTNFMNIALFYPAGLLTASLLPERLSRRRLLITVFVVFALFSSMIEYAQYFWALGEPEIDDVIHNTLGAILGSLSIAYRDRLCKPAK